MVTEGPITGRVAKVLSTTELVVNKGADDGVAVGMKFNVLDPKGLDITDPDTGKVIGSVHRPKVQVVVTQVEAHLSIAATFRYTETNVGGQGLALAQLASGSVSKMFEPPRLVRVYESFRSEEAPWQDISESQSYVKTGDPVEQVTLIEAEPARGAPQHFERSASSSVRPSTTASASVGRARGRNGEPAPEA